MGGFGSEGLETPVKNGRQNASQDKKDVIQLKTFPELVTLLLVVNLLCVVIRYRDEPCANAISLALQAFCLSNKGSRRGKHGRGAVKKLQRSNSRYAIGDKKLPTYLLLKTNYFR